MNNVVRIQWTIFLLILELGSIADPWEASVRTTTKTTKTTRGKYCLRRLARTALEVELCGSRGEDGGRNDDAWYTN